MANPLPRGIQPAFPQEVTDDQVRARLREILGLDGLPGAVEAEVEARAQEGGLVSLRLSYCNSLGEKLAAEVLAPADVGALPGVVCMHGTSGSVAAQEGCYWSPITATHA